MNLAGATVLQPTQLSRSMLRLLQEEAAAHDDVVQVELCELALNGDQGAMARCVKAIDDAEAQHNDRLT